MKKMMLRLVTAAAGVALLGGFAGPAHATTPAGSLPAGILQPVMDAGAPAALLARRDGTTLRTAAAGVTDLASGRKAKATDRVRIGSNTKTMTAVVVVQLAAQGKIRLDDSVERYLPALLPDKRITVRNLLQHTSGLHTDGMLPTDPETIVKNRFKQYSPAQLVRLALTNPKPRAVPGTKMEYSNTNYVVLGMLIERVTGHGVGQELRSRIFAPLEMVDSYLPGSGEAYIAGRHLDGYAPFASGQPLVDFGVYNHSWAWTAGAVVSTVDDETKFLHGLFTGRLVPAKWLTEMENLGSFGYGLGLTSFPAPCVPGGVVWGHNGMVFGYSSLVVSTPDGRTQVAGATTLNFDQDNKAYVALNGALASALCG